MEPKQALQKLGISPETVGYWYMLEAVDLIGQDMRILTTITKQLYPRIAHKFQVTPESIEAALRRVIKNCWASGNRTLMEQIVNHTLPQPPTVGHFLGQLAVYCQTAPAL